jgi:hypothetical protein
MVELTNVHSRPAPAAVGNSAMVTMAQGITPALTGSRVRTLVPRPDRPAAGGTRYIMPRGI